MERGEVFDIEDHKLSVWHGLDKPLGHWITAVAASEDQQNGRPEGGS